MNREDLLARQQSLEEQFKSLRASSDQKRQEIEQIEAELVKLQGRYAELDDLLKLVPAETPQAAEVLTVEPAPEQPVATKEKAHAAAKK